MQREILFYTEEWIDKHIYIFVLKQSYCNMRLVHYVCIHHVRCYWVLNTHEPITTDNVADYKNYIEYVITPLKWCNYDNKLCPVTPEERLASTIDLWRFLVFSINQWKWWFHIRFTITKHFVKSQENGSFRSDCVLFITVVGASNPSEPIARFMWERLY